MKNTLEELAKAFYADKTFFDNDRSFAETHFCEGAEYVLNKAREWFKLYLDIHHKVKTDENGEPLASSEKLLEEVEVLTNNFTEFVTNKQSATYDR